MDIKTCAYPGFPTDLQAPWMAMSIVSEGMMTIHETIFEHRLSHAYELKKLGAVISVMGDHAVINGVSSLSGGAVLTARLRAGAAMWLATLVSMAIMSLITLIGLLEGMVFCRKSICFDSKCHTS